MVKQIDYWLNESKLKDPSHDGLCFEILKNWCFYLQSFNEFNSILVPKKHKVHYEKSEDKYFIKTHEIYYGDKEGRKEISKDKFLEYIEENRQHDTKTLEDYYNSIKKLEWAIPNKYVHAFIDVAILFRVENGIKFSNFNKEISYYGIIFEIKPNIKELGTILRQLSHYNKHLNGNYINVLVSNTKLTLEQIKILREQNIFFINSEQFKKTGDLDGKTEK